VSSKKTARWTTNDSRLAPRKEVFRDGKKPEKIKKRVGGERRMDVPRARQTTTRSCPRGGLTRAAGKTAAG